MNRYKVGDRVRIINHRGRCWNMHGEMDKWQGKIMTIRSVTPHDYRMVEDQGENYGGWSWLESDFAELITTNCSIHITTDGRVTRAIKEDGKKVIAKAEAICSPTDTFDFEVGAKLAFNRLVYGTDYHPAEVAFKRTVREVNRPAKVGEWVAITEGTAAGVIGKVVDVSCDGRPLIYHRKVWFGDKDGMEKTRFDQTKCVVLEGYQPPEKPKKKRIFSTVKFIEDRGAKEYMLHKPWVDKCEGKEVAGGKCGRYLIRDEHTIEVDV